MDVDEVDSGTTLEAVECGSTLEVESGSTLEVELESSSTLETEGGSTLEVESSSTLRCESSITNVTQDTVKRLLSKDEYRSLHVQTLTASNKTSVIVYR